MADLQQIGRALQGFSAGVAGRGPEFIQGLQTQRKQLTDERRDAALLDNRVMLDHLRSGRVPQAKQLLTNRLQTLQQIDPNADPSDTQDMLNLIEIGQIPLLTSEAEVLDREAVIRGLLPAPASAQGEAFTLSPGQTRFSPEGKVIATGKAQDDKSLDQLKFDLQKSKDKFTKAQALRSEIDAISKDFIKVEDAFDRIENSVTDPSPAGDLALIFNFMRLLDPGSVVRESEFRTAADARAWLAETEESGTKVPTFVKQAIQKFEVGTFLVPEQRKDFFGRAKVIFAGADRIHDKRVDARLSIGEQFGIKKSLILGAQQAAGTTIRFDEQGNQIQ